MTIKYVTFNILTMHEYGAAFADYLKLRKKFFVDSLDWKIPHDANVEMDQYDNPNAFYSLVIEDGEVLAGARAMPTTSKWGDHSYMLRDAEIGKIPEIPRLLKSAPVDSRVWECTRLVVNEKITSMRDRMKVLGLIVDGLIEVAETRGGETLLTLSNLWLHRVLNRLGHETTLLCDPYVNADDNHKYAVMAMRVNDQVAPILPDAAPVSKENESFKFPVPTAIAANALLGRKESLAGSQIVHAPPA